MADSLTLITAPTEEPLRLQDVRSWLRIPTSDDDGLLNDLIKSAREEVERETRTQLVQATYDWSIQRFCRVIELPLPPTVSVTHIKYDDSATPSVEQTVSTDVYNVDTTVAPARITLKLNQSWPSDLGGEDKPIRIRIVAGYATQEEIPEGLKLLMRNLIAKYYRFRGDEDTASAKSIDNRIRDLKWGHKIPLLP